MIIKTASRLGDVKEYYFSRKLREIAAMNASGTPVINLGIGSPDLPPAPEVIETLCQASAQDTNHGYQSYKGIQELREGFASWYQQWFKVTLDANTDILPLIGSKEGLMHIGMSFLEAGDQALVPNPGYPAYRTVTELCGAEVLEYDLTADQGWMPDLDKLEEQDLSRVKIMWVNYPNMPTGTPASSVFFEKLIVFAKKHQILIVNDNPYGFILNEEPLSILSLPGAFEVAIELNSLSKSQNMAGWRVGMLAGNKAYIETVLRFKSNMDSGMFKPLQLAAAAALALPRQWYDDLNQTYRLRREQVYAIMDYLGCTYDRNQIGMFVWGQVPEHYASGYELSDEVLEKARVFLTPGGIFGSNGVRYIRISLCTEVALFEEALERIKLNVKTKISVLS